MKRVEAAVESATDESLHVAIGVAGERFDIWFRSSVPLFVERADALVPLGLIPAMRSRRPLEIQGPVSLRLLANAPQVQHILAAFSDGALASTSLRASAAPTTGDAPGGVGSFFSGGVDSFFTALQHRDRLTHLVYVEGFDVLQPDSARAHAASKAAHAAADELELELIQVETNLRTLFDASAPWLLVHGAALAVVGLLLQGRLGRILIPASFSYRDLFPLGSHPLLDPLWGTETLTIEHDGCQANRVDKVAAIANSDTALCHLRVCARQTATFNCGVCNKCVGTMVSLRLAGALDRCTTLTGPLTIRRVASTRLTRSGRNVNWRDNLERARRVGDRRMTIALALVLRPRPFLRVRRALGRLRRFSRRVR